MKSSTEIICDFVGVDYRFGLSYKEVKENEEVLQPDITKLDYNILMKAVEKIEEMYVCVDICGLTCTIYQQDERFERPTIKTTGRTKFDAIERAVTNFIMVKNTIRR